MKLAALALATVLSISVIAPFDVFLAMIVAQLSELIACLLEVRCPPSARRAERHCGEAALSKTRNVLETVANAQTVKLVAISENGQYNPYLTLLAERHQKTLVPRLLPGNALLARLPPREGLVRPRGSLQFIGFPGRAWEPVVAFAEKCPLFAENRSPPTKFS